jgi:hypothetical protein
MPTNWRRVHAHDAGAPSIAVSGLTVQYNGLRRWTV